MIFWSPLWLHCALKVAHSVSFKGFSQMLRSVICNVILVQIQASQYLHEEWKLFRYYHYNDTSLIAIRSNALLMIKHVRQSFSLPKNSYKLPCFYILIWFSRRYVAGEMNSGMKKAISLFWRWQEVAAFAKERVNSRRRKTSTAIANVYRNFFKHVLCHRKK